MQDMLFKNTRTQVAGVDQGVVLLYANVFGKKDSDGDISQAGSFSKTISEQGKRIKHYVDHRLSVEYMIGMPKSLREDDNGLLVESQIVMGKQLAKETYELYKSAHDMGLQMEHSIGYNVINSTYDKSKDANVIQEYKLYEYSTVGLGANQWSLSTAVKSMIAEDVTIEQYGLILEKMLSRNFAYEQLKECEIYIKQLYALIEQGPSLTPDASIKSQATVAELKELLKNYNL